jgi:hypothetical protein
MLADVMEHNSAALPVGRWQRMLRAGQSITAEVAPPLSYAVEMLDKALPLRGLADSVEAADGAGVRAHQFPYRSLNAPGQRCGASAPAQPDAKPVFDLETIGLPETAVAIRERNELPYGQKGVAERSREIAAYGDLSGRRVAVQA